MFFHRPPRWLSAGSLLVALTASAQPDAMTYCVTSPNSVGSGARIEWRGPFHPVGGEVHVTGLPSDRFGMFLYGLQPENTPFGDGVRCIGGANWILARTFTSTNGEASIHLRTEGEVEDLEWLVYNFASSWYFQFAYRDPSGPGGSGFNLSDGVTVDFVH